MTEPKKRGFFSRFFGGAAPEPETQPDAQPTPETPAPEAEGENFQPIETVYQALAETAALEPAPAPELEAPTAEPEQKSWLARLTGGLVKTSAKLSDSVTGIFNKRRLDDDTLEDLEDTLIQADFGLEPARRITEGLRAGRFNKEITPEEVRGFLADEVEKALAPIAKPLTLSPARPHVILVTGVNGAGKTTTIGKIAKDLRDAGKTVMLAAGDTFRAAAIEQLKIWGERTGSPVVAREQGGDATGLAFDALQRAKAEGVDVLIIDTAGRLQNKANLMAELEKIVRVLKKLDPAAPHDCLLILDATTGQNALSQVEIFRKAAGVTGIIMTKLDGTAKGGILVAIADKFGLPVHAIGVGEGIDDLQTFSARDFARAITAS
ncbi:MAG: signal recognition particle-docking protein FtsY [Hyphomicrobiales bacterium]|nr:signal recognition particle-docking protein FtsY [Hyphomicrobiales bacterium]